MNKKLYHVEETYFGDRLPTMVTVDVAQETDKLYIFKQYTRFGKQLRKSAPAAQDFCENEVEAWERYIFKKKEELEYYQKSIAEKSGQLTYARDALEKLVVGGSE